MRVTLTVVEGFWPIFFLAVVLKIPLAAMLYLVWWAIRASDQAELAGEEDDGGFKRPRRVPPRPRGPRRGGPHTADALPLPACPPGGRFRVAAPPAAVRASAREHTDRHV
jgi:hypothetical protein